MSANQSNLSSAKYGYDFVVATTQSSINSTMKEYLSNLPEPEVVICYVADNNGIPTPIDYDTLKQKANGTDPFSVPQTNPSSQDLQNLLKARFMVGFKAQIGLPPGYLPANIPDIVTLGADTSAVSYNLMCSEFDVVQYTPGGGYNPPSWMNVSQPPGAAWLFNSKVDLRLTPFDGTDYSKLPPAVQAQIKNLGGNAFSIQQLLFDLDNAAQESIPTISGVDPSSNLYACLQKDFLGKYFSTMKQNGTPVLGCTVTQSDAPSSTLTLTDLNFETCPLLGTNGQPIQNPTSDQQDASTLNYLCTSNGDPLPAAVQFGWNWLEESDEANFDGVIAINRNAFVNYFQARLTRFVAANCYQPWVNVSLDSSSNPVYKASLSPGQTPTISTPATGATVLSYSYSSSAADQAGLKGDIGKLTVSPSFTLDVSFAGDAITITQHLVIYMYAEHLSTGASGNVVDKTLTDTYSLAVDDKGELTTVLTSKVTDNSQTPSVNGFLNFFTDLNSLINDVATWAQGCASTTLNDIPVAVLQNFVFPGGKTFVFKDASFSDYQDLVAHITYADPS
jgi:hypothetical protein